MEQCATGGDSSHTWLGKFASRLLELRPRASAVSAMRCAVSTFHDAGDLDPRKAADSYAAAYLRMKTMRAAVKADPPSSRYEAMFKYAQAATENVSSNARLTHT